MIRFLSEHPVLCVVLIFILYALAGTLDYAVLQAEGSAQ